MHCIKKKKASSETHTSSPALSSPLFHPVSVLLRMNDAQSNTTHFLGCHGHMPWICVITRLVSQHFHYNIQAPPLKENTSHAAQLCLHMKRAPGLLASGTCKRKKSGWPNSGTVTYIPYVKDNKPYSRQW